MIAQTVLGGVNCALTAAVAYLLCVPLPDLETPATVSPPVSAIVNQTQSGVEPTIEPVGAAAHAMFGSDRDSGPKQSSGPIQLLGDKMAQNWKLSGVVLGATPSEKSAVLVVIKHGNPSVVSRVRLGGSVGEWQLVSATRISADLAKPDGTRVTLLLDNRPASAPSTKR